MLPNSFFQPTTLKFVIFIPRLKGIVYPTHTTVVRSRQIDEFYVDEVPLKWCKSETVQDIKRERDVGMGLVIGN